MTDLTGPRAVMESTFTDACVITFDAGGTHDDVLDPVTLRLSRASDDKATVYTGACSVTPERGATQATEGGDVRTVVGYVVKIPVSASVPSVGALVRVTAAGDPALINQLLRVAEVEQRTRAVSRRLHCELRERVTDRP